MKNILFLLLLSFFASSQTCAQVDDSKLLELIESQRYNDVASYLESIYPNGAQDAKTTSRLAYAYYMSGNLVKAESNYLSLLKLDSTRISTLNSLAAIANKRGNYPQMINYYNKILKIDSTNFFYIKQIANAYQQLDNEELSTLYLQKANKINPEDADVVYDLCKIHILNGKKEEAREVLKPALKADSSNMLLLRTALKLNSYDNLFSEVIKLGEKLLEIGDSSSETYNLLGQAYYYNKNFEKSIKIFQQIIIDTNGNGSETVFYFLGLNYRKLNNLKKSNEFFNRAIAKGISENICIYYQELGANREETNQFTTSIYNYKKALEFSDDIEKVYIVNYSIARIYDAELKQPKTALKYYKEYLKNANKSKKYDKPYIEYSEARVKEITLAK
jgi:tetratricopeptide (TPR) repeat protein